MANVAHFWPAWLVAMFLAGAVVGASVRRMWEWAGMVESGMVEFWKKLQKANVDLAEGWLQLQERTEQVEGINKMLTEQRDKLEANLQVAAKQVAAKQVGWQPFKPVDEMSVSEMEAEFAALTGRGPIHGISAEGAIRAATLERAMTQRKAQEKFRGLSEEEQWKDFAGGSGAGERCWTRENEADEPDETDLLHRH